MMGQKINASGLRLKKRLNWNFNNNFYNKSNYSESFFNAKQILLNNKIILLSKNRYSNKQRITKTSKYYKTFTKLYNGHSMLKNIDTINTNVNFVNNQNKLTLAFGNNSRNFFADHNFSQKKSVISSLKRFNMLLLSPKIITNFVAEQLERSNPYKSNTFKRSLNIGLLKLVKYLSKNYKENLLGVKVICSGKWKKTKSGRKQKLVIKVGRIQNTSLANFLQYDFQSYKTKYGACGIKVWISQKRIENTSKKLVVSSLT